AAVSLRAGDVSTAAFSRMEAGSGERVSGIALSAEEATAFEAILEGSLIVFKKEDDSGFIAESPEKIMRIAKYYQAVNGNGSFPEPACNAPWVSAVIESDGSVLPCFFHKPYGNIHDKDFLSIINSSEAIRF